MVKPTVCSHVRVSTWIFISLAHYYYHNSANTSVSFPGFKFGKQTSGPRLLTDQSDRLQTRGLEVRLMCLLTRSGSTCRSSHGPTHMYGRWNLQCKHSMLEKCQTKNSDCAVPRYQYMMVQWRFLVLTVHVRTIDYRSILLIRPWAPLEG